MNRDADRRRSGRFVGVFEGGPVTPPPRREPGKQVPRQFHRCLMMPVHVAVFVVLVVVTVVFVVCLVVPACCLVF